MLTPTTTSIPICQYGINYHLDWSWIPSKLTHSAFPSWSFFLIAANTQEGQDAVMMFLNFEHDGENLFSELYFFCYPNANPFLTA